MTEHDAFHCGRAAAVLHLYHCGQWIAPSCPPCCNLKCLCRSWSDPPWGLMHAPPRGTVPLCGIARFECPHVLLELLALTADQRSHALRRALYGAREDLAPAVALLWGLQFCSLPPPPTTTSSLACPFFVLTWAQRVAQSNAELLRQWLLQDAITLCGDNSTCNETLLHLVQIVKHLNQESVGFLLEPPPSSHDSIRVMQSVIEAPMDLRHRALLSLACAPIQFRSEIVVLLSKLPLAPSGIWPPLPEGYACTQSWDVILRLASLIAAGPAITCGAARTLESTASSPSPVHLIMLFQMQLGAAFHSVFPPIRWPVG
jgi:hypothetical protein